MVEADGRRLLRLRPSRGAAGVLRALVRRGAGQGGAGEENGREEEEEEERRRRRTRSGAFCFSFTFAVAVAGAVVAVVAVFGALLFFFGQSPLVGEIGPCSSSSFVSPISDERGGTRSPCMIVH